MDLSSSGGVGGDGEAIKGDVEPDAAIARPPVASSSMSTDADTAAATALLGSVNPVSDDDEDDDQAMSRNGLVSISSPSMPPPSSPPPPPPPPSDLAASKEHGEEGSSSSKMTSFEGLWEGFREAKRRKDLLRRGDSPPKEADHDDEIIHRETSSTTTGRSASSNDTPTVLVNFIDPTAASAGSGGSPIRRTMQAANKLVGGGGPSSPRKPDSLSSSSLELYERLACIFSRTYNNRISNVSVPSPRTGAPVVVKQWNVKTVLVPSHGGLVMINSNSQNDSATASTSVPVPDVLGRGGDPAEWHHAPYCHVYMVTCDSLESYRTKVKPSIMVFLSQIGASADSTSSSTSAPSTSSSSHAPPTVTCSQYVIVFVPTLSRAAKHHGSSTSSSTTTGTASETSSSTSSDTSNNNGTSNPIRLGSSIHNFGSRLAAARQLARESLVTGPAAASSSGGGAAESSSSGTADDPSTSAAAMRESLSSSATTTGTANSLAHLSKVDRELAKRLAMDFPMGNVCVLTSLLAVDLNRISQQDDAQLPPLLNDPVHRQEWQHFFKAISSAVLDGFADRCRRYQQELKDHDRLRTLVMSGSNNGTDAGGAAKGASIASGSSSLEARVEAFRQRKRLDLGHYFLLKESLALTYEQVGLVGEALLEYDELKAVVPELGPPTASNLTSTSSSSTKGPVVAAPASLPAETLDEELCRCALRGDVPEFRRRLHAASAPHQQQPGSLAAAQHWSALAPVAHRYLFARATTLLFEMDKSVDVVGRCVPFIDSMYRHQLLQLGEAALAAKDQRIEVEKEAFELAWDIKRACDCYLAEDVSESARELEELDRSRSGFEDDGGAPKSARGARRKIDEALAKAVCDLVEFARLRLLKMGDLALENKNPIRAHAGIASKELERPWAPWKPGTMHTDESVTEDPGDENEVTSSDVIGSALSSPGEFLSTYLELLKVLEAHCRFSGRRRCASRWCVEMAGLHIMRGDHHKAALALRLATKAYAEDRWEACHFLLLFRLAGYQRKVSTADDYLDTLVRCFGACRVAAPPKALDVLLADLEAVLRSTWLSRTRLAAIPIFDPVMGLDGFKPSARSGSARDLLKKVYNVGDKASVNVTLESFLPQEIEADALSVDLVPFQTYVSAMEDSVQIKDDELFAVLAMKDSVVRIRPGVNVYSIDWIPMVSGQFILARTTVTWKSMKFTYTAVDLKRPVMRVDVVPSEPTQTLELSPDYLLPGHKQPIKLSFHGGSDIVSKGALKVVCSPGLLVLPPGEEDKENPSAWSSSYEAPLPPCPPGETVDLELLVHCSDAEKSIADVGSHSLHASVRTWYRPPFPANVQVTEADEAYAKENLAEHELQASVSTTSAQAIALHHEELVPYSLDKALLQVALRSNCPAQLKLSSWDVSLPTILEVSTDLNDTLKGSDIAPHEIFYLTFDCTFCQESPGTAESSTSQLSLAFQDHSANCYTETFALGLRRSAALEQRSRLPRPSGHVPISVEASCATGLVGQPIDLVIKVDASPLVPVNVPIRYCLDFDMSDWIVHGRSEGLLLQTPVAGPVAESTHEVRLEFTIVPCRPGSISSFPALQLFYCQGGGSTSIDASSAAAVEGLDVTHVPGLPFVSLGSGLHTSVACAPSR